MLSVSRWVESCFTWIHFLRRLDTGLSGRGVWAIAESSPAQKNKQSIRIFPINRLVFHRFCVSLSFIGDFDNGYFMQVSRNRPGIWHHLIMLKNLFVISIGLLACSVLFPVLETYPCGLIILLILTSLVRLFPGIIAYKAKNYCTKSSFSGFYKGIAAFRWRLVSNLHEEKPSCLWLSYHDIYVWLYKKCLFSQPFKRH